MHVKALKYSNGEGNFKSTIFQRLNLNFQRVGGKGFKLKTFGTIVFFFIHVALSGQPHTSWDFERFMNSLFSKIIVH